ncbi:dipeptidase [Sphingobacterium faecium]|uniref:dipeptidase n=1 Tax=Sphingobacterium faecium TaxID=34087 RepID=UPI00097F18C2|nr:dipeptidase [Sphingobacterium faecium]WGQ16754.1 dipeptidase [Sphingobacterium faecium]SJN32977.1 Zn-dependent dipeptidase, microsomal dipeptidase homolog [Sphingobacterium faecium PCAi_F2.5]HCU44358.1 membrane dipeptidase [Sphingobacterium sp.]
MKNYVLRLALILSVIGTAKAQDYGSIHQQMIVVDGHNDVIITSILKGHDISQQLMVNHTDIPRLIVGGVDVQVFAVWSDDKKWKSGAFKHANDQIDALEKVLDQNPDQIEMAKNSGEIERIIKSGKIAALIGIEGGNMIEADLQNLEALYKRGARYMTLTWNYDLSWATAAAQESKTKSREGKGLSALGKEIIRRMNKLGMMVDLSHAGEQTFYDVLEISTKPVLVSHSNSYSLTPHFRNLKDAQLEALKKNRGVVGVNFYSGFLDKNYEKRVKKLYKKQFGKQGNYSLSASSQYEQLTSEHKHVANVSMSLLLDHIDYLVKKIGIDHVAIGSDYDGIESTPQGLEDVSKFPNLTHALLKRGYDLSDIAKIMGLNFLRILKENEN